MQSEITQIQNSVRLMWKDLRTTLSGLSNFFAMQHLSNMKNTITATRRRSSLILYGESVACRNWTSVFTHPVQKLTAYSFVCFGLFVCLFVFFFCSAAVLPAVVAASPLHLQVATFLLQIFSLSDINFKHTLVSFLFSVIIAKVFLIENNLFVILFVLCTR